MSVVPLSCIASAHSSNTLQEKGSRTRRDAEFQGGKNPNLLFKRIVTGVRIGRDVHEVLRFWRTDLFKLRSDQHGSHTHQLQLSFRYSAEVEVLVDQTDRPNRNKGRSL